MSPRSDDTEALARAIDRVVFAQPAGDGAPDAQSALLALISYLNDSFPRDPGARDSRQPGVQRLGSAGDGDESAARQSRSPLDAGHGWRRPGVTRLRRPRRVAPAGRREAGDRGPPVVAKPPADIAVTSTAMGRWTNGATRGGVLALLLLTAAVLPGRPIARQPPLGAISVVARAAADENDDHDGFMEHSSPAVPTPTAAALISELVVRKAPIPVGPVTYPSSITTTSGSIRIHATASGSAYRHRRRRSTPRCSTLPTTASTSFRCTRR